MEINYIVSSKHISYSDYCNIVREAYVDSVNKFNIDSSTGKATPDLLEDLVKSQNGVFFAAYVKDTLVAGAILIRYRVDKWYCHGEVCETKYLSVHPNYQRRGIAKHLKSMIFDYIKENGYKCIISTINANNRASINLQLSDGYLPVDTYIGYHKHRTLRMIKWFDKPSYHNWYRLLRYRMKYLVTIIK